MKTRTLLLLSVGTALMILVAGGVFLFQLSAQEDTVPVGEIGVPAELGDATVTVLGSTGGDPVFAVEIEIAGVDDPEGLDNFRLVTGDRQLEPLAAPADGRCSEFTVEVQMCRLDFDVGAAESSSRVLVMRRGEDQRTWDLGE